MEKVNSRATQISAANKIVVKEPNPGDMIALYPTPESIQCKFCVRDNNKCPTVQAENTEMISLVATDKSNQVQSIFEGLIKLGHKPSLVTYTILLIALINQKRFNLIHPIVSQVKEIKMKPDLKFYNTVIRAFCEARNVEEGMKVFWEMKSVGIEPTTKTFDHLLFGYILEGKNDGALNLLELMSEVENDEHIVRACNLLVKAFCRVDNINKAMYVVGKMKNLGLQLHTSTYNKIAVTYCRIGDPKKGEEVVFEMRSHDVATYPNTCGSIIRAYCNEGKVKDASSFLYKMKDLGVRPNVIIFNLVIKELLHVEDGDCFDEVLTLMEEYEIEPDVVTFGTILNSWSRAGYMDKCLALFSDMVKAGIEPDYRTYCILAKGCVRAGKPEKAQELVAPMIKSGIQFPNEVFFTTVISGWCFTGHMDNAFYMFDQMCRCGVQPELLTFQFLIKCFVEAQQPWRAEEMIQRMSQYNMRPDGRTLALIEEAKAKFNGTKNRGLLGSDLVDDEKKEVKSVYGNSVLSPSVPGMREKVSVGTSKQSRVLKNKDSFSFKNVYMSCSFVCMKQVQGKSFACCKIAQLSKVGFLR